LTLGVQVLRDRSKRQLSLGLPKYTAELETKFQPLLAANSSKGRGARSPMTPDTMKKLKDPESWDQAQAAAVSREHYMSLLGSLMFASLTLEA